MTDAGASVARCDENANLTAGPWPIDVGATIVDVAVAHGNPSALLIAATDGALSAIPLNAALQPGDAVDVREGGSVWTDCVASSGGDYLTLFKDGGSTFAMRLSPDGAVSSEPIPLAEVPAASQPVAHWEGTSYGIAWDANVDGDIEIFFQGYGCE